MLMVLDNETEYQQHPVTEKRRHYSTDLLHRSLWEMGKDIQKNGHFVIGFVQAFLGRMPVDSNIRYVHNRFPRPLFKRFPSSSQQADYASS